jgi:hypothetical protein
LRLGLLRAFGDKIICVQGRRLFFRRFFPIDL